MKNLLSILFLFLCLSSNLLAQEDNLSIFQTANQHYENAEFDKAEALYLDLLEHGYISDDLHFNLANAYFKTKQIAPAILHYEKALKINPSNQDAAYNLKLANDKTVDKVESIPDLFIYRWWKSIYNFNSADTWAKIAVALFFLTAVCFLIYLFSSTLQLRKFSFYAAVICILIGVFTWILAEQQSNYLEAKEYAVIMQPTVNIISAPSAGSSQLFVLHEGTKVKIKDETDAWLKIALPNGNEGWVEKEVLEAI